MKEEEASPEISRYEKPRMKVYEVTIRGFILGEEDLPHPNSWGWDDLNKRVRMDFVGFPDIEVDQGGVDVYQDHHDDGSQWLEIIDGVAQEIHAIKAWDKKGNVEQRARYEELKPVYDKILDQTIWHISA